MTDSTMFQEGSILTFIEIDYGNGEGSTWAVSEDDNHTKYIVRNTLACGGHVRKILKVKVTDEYMIDPELKRVEGYLDENMALREMCSNSNCKGGIGPHLEEECPYTDNSDDRVYNLTP